MYVAQDFMYQIFIERATKEGWWYKVRYSSFENKMYLINPQTGDAEFLEMTVPAPVNNVETWPYLDTFSYGGETFLTNNEDNGAVRYRFNGTDGSRECLTDDGDWLDESDYDRQGQVEIGMGPRTGEWVDEDEAVYS